jgi:hypothetical protein
VGVGDDDPHQRRGGADLGTSALAGSRRGLCHRAWRASWVRDFTPSLRNALRRW